MIWLVFQAAAITLVVTEGSIFGRLRTFGPALWRQLVSCSLCLGTWVGMGMFVLHSPPTAHYAYWIQVLGFGCVSGVAAFVGAMVIACLDRWSGPDEVQMPPPQPVPTSADIAKLVQQNRETLSPEIRQMVQEMREKGVIKNAPPRVGQ